MRKSLQLLAVGLLSSIVVLSSLGRLLAEDSDSPKPAISDSAEKQNSESAFKMTRAAAQNNVEHNGKSAWHCNALPFREVVTSHKLPYTSFKFDKP